MKLFPPTFALCACASTRHHTHSLEHLDNRPHACCEDPRSGAFSRYGLKQLAPAVERGLRLAIPVAGAEESDCRLRVADAVDGLEALTRGSGGSSLLVALSACRQVSVYGTGLLRFPAREGQGVADGPQLVYTHAYDDAATRCVTDTEVREWVKQQRYCRDVQCREARAKWLRDRLATEFLLHVLHALGVVTWR